LEVFVAEELVIRSFGKRKIKNFLLRVFIRCCPHKKSKEKLFCIVSMINRKTIADDLAKAVNANHGNKQEKNIKSLLA
jgi:hypothetical protein